MRVISRLSSSMLEVINRKWLRDRESGLYLLAGGKGHHSFADWTWTVDPAAGWASGSFQLSIVKFVSAPSSVQHIIRHLALEMTGIAVCDIASVSDLKEGRIVTQLNGDPSAANKEQRIIFGAEGDVTDPYRHEVIGWLDTIWGKLRITWWNSYNLLNQPKLAVREDRWIAGAWAEQAIVYQNRLAGVNNKCGLGAWSDIGFQNSNYWDDTEIWG